jgi:hypothetical protein
MKTVSLEHPPRLRAGLCYRVWYTDERSDRIPGLCQGDLAQGDLCRGQGNDRLGSFGEWMPNVAHETSRDL